MDIGRGKSTRAKYPMPCMHHPIHNINTTYIEQRKSSIIVPAPRLLLFLLHLEDAFLPDDPLRHRRPRASASVHVHRQVGTQVH